MVHDGSRIECVTRNISLGGMYLVTESPLPYGSKVTLEIYLPALREEAKIEAIVRWEKPDGMGVQFGNLGAVETHTITELSRNKAK